MQRLQQKSQPKPTGLKQTASRKEPDTLTASKRTLTMPIAKRHVTVVTSETTVSPLLVVRGAAQQPLPLKPNAGLLVVKPYATKLLDPLVVNADVTGQTVLEATPNTVITERSESGQETAEPLHRPLTFTLVIATRCTDVKLAARTEDMSVPPSVRKVKPGIPSLLPL